MPRPPSSWCSATATSPASRRGRSPRSAGRILDMAFDAAVRGAVLGLVPVVVWLLVGPARRRELAHHHGRAGVVVGLALVAIAVLIWQPWAGHEPTGDERARVDVARLLPRPRGAGARGGGGRRGPDRRDDRRVAAAGRERGRHLREEPDVLRLRGRRRGGTRPPGAAGGRHRRRRWSPTATTTSAWTAWPGRSRTRVARQRSSTPATTPRPASPGRPSASTR